MINTYAGFFYKVAMIFKKFASLEKISIYKIIFMSVAQIYDEVKLNSQYAWNKQTSQTRLGRISSVI